MSLGGTLVMSSGYVLLGFSCVAFGNVSFPLLGLPTAMPIKKIKSEVSSGTH